MMRASARRVRKGLLEVHAIIHEGEIPFARIFLVQSLLDERHELVVGDLLARPAAFFLFYFRKEEMDIDRADVRLDERAGDVEREGKDGASGVRAYSWKFE